MKDKEIWCGQIPDIYGYGIMIFANSESRVKTLLKAEFYKWRKSYNSSTKFKDAFENWGGRITKVKIEKAYFDNLGE